MTLKQRLIKFSYKIIRPIQKVYWLICRPHTRGVKCLIQNNDKFLLVKLNYAHNKWTVPGGGVKRKESSLDAATREAKEETGVTVINPIFIGFYKSRVEYKNDTVEVYVASADTLEVKIDPFEIKEAKWFSLDELPENRTPSVDRILDFYAKHGTSR